MGKQVFDDSQIKEMVDQLKNKQMGLKKLELKCIQDGVYIDFIGIEGIPNSEEYYENLEDHLICAEFQWISSLHNLFNVKLSATVTVNPDGSFDHKNIEVEIQPMVKSQGTAKLLSFLKKLLPFRQFLNQVEFSWHSYELNHITFYLKLDGQKVNSLLKNASEINTQILSQWLAAIDVCKNFHQGRYKHKIIIPIVNSRINTSTFETAVSFKFNQRGRS